jgi:hypothetical protein
MRTCRLFDKYRDKELSPEERERFEMHLADCVDCQTKKYLISNVAFVLKQEEAIASPDLSRRIAFRAFAQKKTWDSLVISWLRPGPALATLTVALALFSFLWIFMGSQTTAINSSEYEVLINDADSLNLTVNASQVRADNDLWLWLEQERNYQ